MVSHLQFFIGSRITEEVCDGCDGRGVITEDNGKEQWTIQCAQCWGQGAYIKVIVDGFENEKLTTYFSVFDSKSAIQQVKHDYDERQRNKKVIDIL